jgi:hypothetical protein
MNSRAFLRFFCVFLLSLGTIGSGEFSCSGDSDCRSCEYYAIDDLINAGQYSEAISRARAGGFSTLLSRAQVANAIGDIDVDQIFDANDTNDLLDAIAPSGSQEADDLKEALESGTLSGDQQIIGTLSLLAYYESNPGGDTYFKSDEGSTAISNLSSTVSSRSDLPAEVKDVTGSGAEACTDWACLCGNLQAAVGSSCAP